MEKDQRDFKGIWIPKNIWCSKKLTLQEKVMLVEIDSLNGVNGCYASNTHFAEMFDISRQRCVQIINSLERKNYIKITRELDSKKQTIRTIETTFNNSSPVTPLSSTLSPVKENLTAPVKVNLTGVLLHKTTNNTNTKHIVREQKSLTKSVYKNRRYIPIAKILAKIVEEKRRVKVDEKRLIGWLNDIRLLCEQDEVGRIRLKKILEWYAQNYTGEYIPVIESGVALREKFTRLEDSMLKQKKKINGSNITSIGHVGNPIKYKEAVKV